MLVEHLMRNDVTRRALALASLALAACSAPTADEAAPDEPATSCTTSEALTVNARVSRYATMRDSARAHGIPANGYLLAGIAYDETGVAMCWSEATWACKGPNSPDCGGGPVIAGAADGPCSAQQGGLGMFQFDAGTFSQTIAKYGDSVLTVDGQIKAVVPFVVDMVRRSAYTTNAETPEKALAWINAFDPADATLKDQWIKTVVRYYNGCRPTSSCWSSRIKTYTDGLDTALADTGGTKFWADGPPAPTKPADDDNGSDTGLDPHSDPTDAPVAADVVTDSSPTEPAEPRKKANPSCR